MSSLLPRNASAAERAIEAAIARAGSVPVPVRDLIRPDTCPAFLLPWLAWQLSIDNWKDYWPEAVKRERLRTALDVQRRKGTVASIRQVVAAFGGHVTIREWHELDPPGAPHTFELSLVLTGTGVAHTSAQYVDDVINEVIATKPVRSHFTFTQGLTSHGGIGLAGAARAAIYRRLQFTAIEA